MLEADGLQTFRSAYLRSSRLLVLAFVFSIVVNFLMLVGPLYMMQVYDRVLGSRSEETLVALTLLITFLFVMMGTFDHLRGRLMSRVGARLQEGLDQHVFRASLRRAIAQGRGSSAPLRDVESVQRLISSPVILALFDLPWTPMFFFGIFLFHPYLGMLGMFGGLVLIAIALLNQKFTTEHSLKSGTLSGLADETAKRFSENAELVRTLGMQGAAYQRWMAQRQDSLNEAIAYSDRSGLFTVSTKTMRQYLQSAMLGLGAFLVLKGAMSPGGMIAGSILMGRALAPVEQIIGQWQMVISAKKGRQAIIELLDEQPLENDPMALPRPKGNVVVKDMVVAPPGSTKPLLHNINFEIAEGQVMGIIGSSGGGKTSLARALTGAWPLMAGTIRLDGAALDQFDPDVLGSYIGHLPQTVTLFPGTIAENISRFSPDAQPGDIVAAAKRANAHDMILSQANGYDTPVEGRLSGGQVQRIGLARAMFGEPELLILDEPNSNLDNQGTIALNSAIRQLKETGKTVAIIAHRPAALQECDVILVLENGTVAAFGPRDDILRNLLRQQKQQDVSQLDEKKPFLENRVQSRAGGAI